MPSQVAPRRDGNAAPPRSPSPELELETLEDLDGALSSDGRSNDENRHEGWALARSAFLSSESKDAIADVMSAAQSDNKAAATAAMERYRGVRSGRNLMQRITTGARSTLNRAVASMATATSSTPVSPGSSRPTSPQQSKPLRELMLRDAREGVSREQGFFGSIRFPTAPRAVPSKFIRLASTHDFADPAEARQYSKHVVALALATWKLPPPCAMISILEAGRMGKLQANSRLELVLRRGLAQAARKTGAWLITSGSAADAAARTAGRAMLHLANEHGDAERMPTIGMLPWVACKEHEALDQLPNGYCRAYEGGRTILSGASAGALKAAGMAPLDLEPNHSHFLMVDADDAAASITSAQLLRGSVEKFISDTDVSGDNIQTPKVLLVMGGGAEAFAVIRDQLDPYDPKTGTAVPVLVIADSGGAADDIHAYCTRQALPIEDADAGRDAAYIIAATEHLPAIKRLGELTGQNSRQQLAFFTLSEDLDARDDLALEIQRALLNDCPNIKEEALLAVKWKEPVILQQHLQDSAQELLNKKRDKDGGGGAGVGGEGGGGKEEADDEAEVGEEEAEAENANVDLLQVALMRPGGADVEVVRTILAFVSEPSDETLKMDELFHKQFDRYPVEETKGLWKGARRKRGQGGAVGGAAGSGRLSEMRLSEMRRVSETRVSTDGDASGGGSSNGERDSSAGPLGRRAASFSGLLRMGSRQSLTSEAALLGRWVHAAQVLATVVDGYRDHLDARMEMGTTWKGTTWRGGLRPNWTDLMMWAVLSGQHDLAEALWEKTQDPIRAALMASQLCRRLSQNGALRADSADLLNDAERYEDCALDVLDAIRDSSEAAPLLTLIPWKYVDRAGSGSGASGGGVSGSGAAAGGRDVQRRLLWEASPLESAAEEDGLLSVPCMRFISHRHSQYLLDKHFAGDFAGSKARIPQEGVSLVSIAIQAFLPLLPGTVVEVMPCEEVLNVARSGASVAADRSKEQGTGGLAMDPDLVEVLEELQGNKLGLRRPDENTLADLLSDLLEFRWLTFYAVPKVKFVLHLMQHVGFMALLTAVLLSYYADDALSYPEVAFWAWTLTRTLGELNELDSFDASGLRLYLRDIWNQMDVVTFLLVVAIAALRVVSVTAAAAAAAVEEGGGGGGGGGTLRRLVAKGGEAGGSNDPGEVAFEPAPPLDATARCLYALLVILVFVRAFQYLRLFKALGVLSIVLGGIISDVAIFAFIQLTLLVAFGIAFAVLQPGPMAAYDAHEVLGRAPFWVPFWGLYGEFSMDRMLLQVNDEKPTIVLLPLLLWLYLFIATIILVNLLIAQMSDTFSRITGEGLLRWQFERCQLISEFKETKPPLPPPLNVIWLLFVTLPHNLFRGERGLRGFKTLPSSRQLAHMQQRENAALQRCLLHRTSKQSATVEARCDLSVREIHKLQEQNQARFENMNGRMDKIMSELQGNGSKRRTATMER
jgi:hypothetical protein